MKLLNIEHELKNNPYPGRGILIGRDRSGDYAVCAYFIMGRSENSRNRIFIESEDGIETKAWDESKLSDPSLIIYHPVRVYEGRTIVTNGDQTDTIFEGLKSGRGFTHSLATREFEPDSPNYTPRISGIMDVRGGDYSFKLSILKSDCGRPEACLRYTFSYDNPMVGEGRFIHTYQSDGDPLPSFCGEPERVAVEGGIDELSAKLWNSLNEDNKVSLFVRYINIGTGKWDTRIINKHTS